MRLKRLLGYNLARADVRVSQTFQKVMAPLQLRQYEYSILVLVDSNDMINQKQIGQVLDISAPNLAVILDRLTERGLLTRVRSETDRRAQNLHLTDEGRALLAESERAVQTMEHDLVRNFTEGERVILLELLQRLISGKARG